MDNPQIQLVCFDLGGVLIRTGPGWDQACARAGIKGLPGFFTKSTPARADLVKQYEVGRVDDVELLQRVASECPNYTEAQIGDLLDAWLDGLYEGVQGILDALHESDVMTACLSNTNARHWHTIMNDPAYHVVARLDHRFVSHLAGARKPGPEFYEHLERSLPIGPESILYFDDLRENVDAARRRGWHAVLVDPAKEPAGQIRQVLRVHGIGVPAV